MKKMCYNSSCSAGVAHPVERHLAKVEVASSSLVTRSIKSRCCQASAFFFCSFSPSWQHLQLCCRDFRKWVSLLGKSLVYSAVDSLESTG